MQNLRALVAERSVMTMYIRGETIEIPHHSIGILLEGYVKTQVLQELVTSPAALLPSQGNLSFRNLEISGSLSYLCCLKEVCLYNDVFLVSIRTAH